MTISSATTVSGPYTGNGATTVFAYNFKILDQDDIEVTLTSTAGVETVKTISTHYTVSGVGSASGNVTMLTAPASGEKVTLRRKMSFLQELDLQNQGAYLAEDVETALDKLTMYSQQVDEVLDRCVKVPISSSDSPDDYYQAIQDNATAAAASESAAAGSASSAATSASTASTAATSASNSAGTASTQATNASNSASAASTSASNAATAETNAETAEANAETAQAAAELAQASAEAAAAALFWNFDTTTSMTDPGTGDLRLNNATVASVTAIAVSALTASTGNPDVSDQIVTWDDSTNTAKGTITIRKAGTPATFAVFTVTGTVTDNTTWLQLSVTHVASNGALSAGDDLYLAFSRAGDSGGGDVSGPGSSTADAIVLFNGTGGKTIKDSAYTITAAGAALLDDANAAAQRTTLGLGTAATAATGTSGNALPFMDGDNTWSGSQRGAITTDNDGSFDQSAANNFFCTTAGSITLTFTNHTSGQSGLVLFVNASNHAVSAAATTKIKAADLTTISATGTYLLTYFDNGTNAYVVCSGALT